MLPTHDRYKHTHASVLSHLLKLILSMLYVLRILILAPCPAVNAFYSLLCAHWFRYGFYFSKFFTLSDLTLLCDFSHNFRAKKFLPLEEHYSCLSFRLACHHPLQCSCLENPRDGGAWWAAVYGVAQSQTRLKWLSSSSSSSSSSSLSSFLRCP